jgi:hypothetical protein
MKAYKFFSDPGRIVTDGDTGKVLLKFDEKGEYITLDEKLAIRMSAHFEHKEIELIEVQEQKEEVKEEVKELRCKKCDFVTDNKGSLMAHYRENHPKEG